MKKCVICNSEILGLMRKKTCSSECGDELVYRRAKELGEKVKANKPVVHVACQCCGTIFLKKFNQIYCSDKCRVKVNKRHTAQQYVRLKLESKSKSRTQCHKIEAYAYLQE